MGAVASTFSRRIQRFNLENRAQREISKEKPTPAPTYPSTNREIERLAKEDPQFLEEQSRRDVALHERLKNVFLISHDDKEEANSETTHPGKSLPLNRNTPEETDFGFLEPKMIPKGKVTLRQALKFIAEYQSDPKSSAASSIASKHKINVEITENILKYFRTFEIYIPENKGKISGENIAITQIEGRKQIEEKPK